MHPPAMRTVFGPPFRSGAWIGLAVAIALATACAERSPPADGAAVTASPALLQAGTSHAGPLAPGTSVTLAVACREPEVVEVRLVQHGLEARVAATRDDGETLAGMDFNASTFGDDLLLLPGRHSGRCELTIEALPTQLPPGRFELIVGEARARDARAELQLRAQAAYADARRAEGAGDAAGFETALRGFEDAAALAAEAGDELRQLYATHDVASLRRDQAQLAAAVDAALHAERLATKLGLPRWQGLALLVQGSARGKQGDRVAALALADAAAALFHDAADPASESMAHNNAGLAHQQLGHIGEALDRFDTALALARGLGDLQMQASPLHNLAGIRQDAADYTGALQLYQQALGLARAIRQPALVAGASLQIGRLYRNLGEPDTARAHLSAALDYGLAAGDKRMLGNAQHSLGWVAIDQGRPDEARVHFAEALALARAAGNPSSEAFALGGLGLVESMAGRSAAARDHLRAQVALLRGLEQPYMLAGALRTYGDELRQRGEFAAAERAYAEAWDQARAYDDAPALFASILRSRAANATARGRLADASEWIEQAMTHADTARRGVGDDELRSGFTARLQPVYRQASAVFLARAQGEDADRWRLAALQAVERGRSRLLHDVLARARLHGVDDANATPEQRRRAELEREMAVLANARLRQRQSGKPADEGLANRLDALRAEAAALPAHPGDRLLRPPQVDAGMLRRVLDDDAVLLEYALGDTQSDLWVVDHERVRHVVVADRATIEALVKRVRLALGASPAANATGADAGAELASALAALGREVIAPAGDLSRYRRLVIVPDGALHYLPFALLPSADAKDRLVDRYDMIHAPSIGVLDVIRARASVAPTSTVAIVADPVFDAEDPRIAAPSGFSLPRAVAATPGFERLVYSRREAHAISALVGDATLVLDFAARRDRVLGWKGAHFGVLHFATHAVVDDREPDLSGIVLSMLDEDRNALDGLLNLRDIWRLPLSADLVVLSGCETAVGADRAGDGLQALSQGFMRAGARRVLASLWPVDDSATAALMSAFYAEHLVNGRPPDEALRRAQHKVAAETRWRDPYYWAGFVLQGDWR